MPAERALRAALTAPRVRLLRQFNALPEADFNALRSKGWLPFIYLSLASFSNWKQIADRQVMPNKK